MYNLFELLKGIEYRLSEYKNEKIYVTGVAHDSREVLPGNIFICIKGKKKTVSAISKKLRNAEQEL